MAESPTAWLARARSVIEAKIATYETTEIQFNLMAVVADRLQALHREIEEQEAIRGSMAETMRDDAELKLAQLRTTLGDELAKRDRWAVRASWPCIVRHPEKKTRV